MTINELKNKIKEYNYYYRIGSPKISDFEYDRLLEKLKDVIDENEYLKFRKELMDYIGEEDFVFPSFIKMGSLEKIKDTENEKINKFLKDVNEYVLIQEKIDGISVLLYFNKGNLILASTRGNGIKGKIITDKVKLIIDKIDSDEEMWVRGELVWVGELDKKYKNKRNAVAGIFNLKELDDDNLKIIKNNIKVITYQIYNKNLTKLEQLEKLQKQLNLKTPNYFIFSKDFKDINVKLKELLINLKNKNEYDIDGLVLCSSDYKDENELIPKKIVAFKSDIENAISEIIDIKWNISKDNKLKPIAIINPVELNETVVKKVTLYNYRYIVDNKIGVGTKIRIIKSGEIIPKIDEIIEAKGFKEIIDCPFCNNKLEIVGVDLVCSNKNCSDAKYKKIEIFLRNIGVEGASYISLRNYGIENFYNLIDWVPNSEYKNQVKLYEEIKSKLYNFRSKVDILKNMPFEGLSTINLEKIFSFYTTEEITNYVLTNTAPSKYPKGVNEKTFRKLYKDWNYFYNFSVVVITKAKKINPSIFEEKIEENKKLNGITFLITGTLSKPRNEFEKLIIENGGKIASGVTKNLDYLIVGEKPGSKLEKAKNLGVKIISEDGFFELIEDKKNL